MQSISNPPIPALRLTLVALVAAFSLPVMAQNQLRDEATGLSVQLPPGYSVTKSPPRPRQDVVFSIRSESGQPAAKNRDGTLCGLAFAKAPSNAALSQKQINAMSRQTEWRNLAKATLEMVFDVQRVDGIAVNGIEGVAIYATPKAAHPDQDVLMHMSLLETPKGRTTLACVTSKAEADSAVPAFESIRSGVKPPF